MVNPCRSNIVFSSQSHRTGLLVVGALSLIAWIYRRSIWEFFYPSKPIPSQKSSLPQNTPTKQPIPRKFTAVQIPSSVAIAYQGSNAEYIVFKKDGSPLTEQEYLDLAVPILKLQFPRNKEIEETLSPDVLDQLDQNEIDYIDKALEAKGLKAIKIPKTLYDIFYIAFRFHTSASSLKEGEACQATTSLERFLDPAARIYRYGPDVLVQEKDIHKVFIKIDKENQTSKVDAGLNNYIFQDLTQRKYMQDALSWEAIISVVDDLFHRINSIQQANEREFNCLYNQKCPSKDCKVSEKNLDIYDRLMQGHWNHYVFRMIRNFDPSQTQILALFKKALWVEFSQSSSVYTCYRGGQQEMEREPTTPTLHSGSYGHSLCSSCELDMGGAGAIPIEYAREYGYGYAVSINKAEYRKDSVGHFFVVPPAQRTARFRLDGEFTHVRTRTHQPSSTEEAIHGMQNIASAKVPYIVTRGSYATPELFEKELRKFLDRYTYSLTE